MPKIVKKTRKKVVLEPGETPASAVTEGEYSQFFVSKPGSTKQYMDYVWGSVGFTVNNEMSLVGMTVQYAEPVYGQIGFNISTGEIYGAGNYLERPHVSSHAVYLGLPENGGGYEVVGTGDERNRTLGKTAPCVGVIMMSSGSIDGVQTPGGAAIVKNVMDLRLRAKERWEVKRRNKPLVPGPINVQVTLRA